LGNGATDTLAANGQKAAAVAPAGVSAQAAAVDAAVAAGESAQAASVAVEAGAAGTDVDVNLEELNQRIHPDPKGSPAQKKKRRHKHMQRFADSMRWASTGLFKPKTWAFWRATIVCFCVCCIVGHWFEMPYCSIMDLFGIVADDYAVWTDPWYHPYWVYGAGAVGLILGIEPLKEYIMKKCKTLRGAFMVTWLIAIFLSMIMELVFGLIVNQPDANGVYPYWDNSQLPLNVFGQAWLVNDVFIGLAGMLCIWFIFPLVCAGFRKLEWRFDERAANIVLMCVVAAFCMCCLASYTELKLWLK